MQLRYTDLTGASHDVSATITTDSPLSSYGQPVVLLEDGGALDGVSWVLLGYRVISYDDDAEQAMMGRWLDLVNTLTQP